MTPLLSTDISALTLALFGVAAVAAVAVVLIVVPRLRRVSHAVAADTAEAEQGFDVPDEAWPAVSVIVHSRSDASALQTLIPMILAQRYAGIYEIIVVNDGSDDAVSNVVGALQNDYRNLYMTFTPAASRSLSRRKLAITLGIKAARYDCVAIIAGNARLKSDRWLSALMQPIARGKEVSVGYGYTVAADPEYSRRHRLLAFERVRASVQYLGSALAGRLYRAFGNNVAYRRGLFFDRKGFSDSLNLHFGDDDLFISQIARRDNYGVVLDSQAMVEIAEETPAAMMRLDKLRHDFTGRMVSRRQLRLWGFASLMWWVWTLCSVAASLTSLPSLIPLMAVTAVSLALCFTLMAAWRRCSAALCSRRLFLTVPFFFWAQPFYTLVYRVMGRKKRASNYTWSTL